MGLTKWRHPSWGWIAEKKMQDEIDAAMCKLTGDAQNAVKAIIRILQDNAGLPKDHPASRLFQK
jgi:hypothetical protein